MGWLFQGPFHQSHLRDASLCRKMFELKYRYGAPAESRSLPMVNGTAIHRAIERIHEGDLFHFGTSELQDLFRDCFTTAEAKEDIPIRWKTDRTTDIDSLEFDAAQILENYTAQIHNRDCKILLSEAEFSVDIGGYPFEGRIDQVRKRHDRVIQIDFKSGKMKPMPLVLRIGLQHSVYTHGIVYGEFKEGCNGMNKELPDEVVHYQLHDHLPYKKSGKWGKKGDERGPAWYSTVRTEHDMQASTAEIKRICGDIRRGTFSRTGQDMICRMCKFQDACEQDYLHGGLNDKLARKLRITLSEEDE